jgi:hypothetical protein
MTTVGKRPVARHRTDHRSPAKEAFPMHPVAFLALDLAEDRAREANNRRRAALIASGRPVRPSWPRRNLAAAFAFVSRSSAGAARRLDSYVADDLRRTLAATK